MFSVGLHARPALPVAASPTAPVVMGGGGSTQIVPAAGQSFTPASPADANAAAGASPAAPAPDGAQGAQAPQGSPGIDAQQGLAALKEEFGKEYNDPIVAADGSVYMERKQPEVVNGQLVLTYKLVAKIDGTTGKMIVNPEFLKAAGAKAEAASSDRQLVKVGDQYTWQTLKKGEDGKITADVTPVSDEELQKLQAEQAQKQAAEAQKAAQANGADWQQKIGVVAQDLGLFGSIGQLTMGLASGPNAYTGKPGASWLSAWILAQRLNGKTEGKLLPKWLQQGPGAIAVDWGIQAYSLLDIGRDIRTIKQFMGKAEPLAAINPNAVANGIKAGLTPQMAEAVVDMGAELRSGGLQLVAGSPNAAILNTKLGAVQLIPRDKLHQAMELTENGITKGMKVQQGINTGVNNGLGLLKGLVQPAMIGATALGLVSSSMTVKNVIKQAGVRALIDTKQGRGALLGALSSAAFLGMYLVPTIAPAFGAAAATVGAISAGMNITSSIMGGVSLLNSYGLFGGDDDKKAGFLDNDGIRAAFLIPPLTPLGAFAFYRKKQKQKKAVEAAKLEAAQQQAVTMVTQQRKIAQMALQQSGAVQGAQRGADGSIMVPTSVPNDLSKLAAQMNGAPAAAAGSSGGAPPAAGAPAASADAAPKLSAAAQRPMISR